MSGLIILIEECTIYTTDYGDKNKVRNRAKGVGGEYL